MALGTAVERELDHASGHATRCTARRRNVACSSRRRTGDAASSAPSSARPAPAAAARSLSNNSAATTGAEQQGGERHAVHERRAEQQITLRQGDRHRRSHGERRSGCRASAARSAALDTRGRHRRTLCNAAGPRTRRQRDRLRTLGRCRWRCSRATKWLGSSATRRPATRRSFVPFAAGPRPSP